jgi:osmotically-inducible protein OsmY
MADYNRNRGPYRTSNQDWNENRSRSSRYEDSDRNYGSSEFRGSENREYDENTAGWQSRHERERDRDDYGRGDMYSTGRHGRHYDSDFNSGNYAGDRDYGYASYYGSGSNYGGMSGDYKNRDRNLYDRDYEGMGRRGYSSSGTRFGAGNYGSYGDMSRYENEGRSQGRGGYGYSGSGEGYGGRNREERNWWDRTTDEVSSWFGDEEAERRRDRDKQMGQYRGKGPKNYSRSDERIKDDVNDRLSDDPFIDASEIDVTVSSGEVTLTGTVEHRSAKRRAEDLAEAVSGVKNVENRIRVGQTSDYRNPEKESQTTGSQATTSQSTSGVAGSERSRSKSYVTG